MVKRTISMALAFALVATTPACTSQAPEQDNQTEAAQAESIEGTWKADLASAKFDEKPSEYLLKDGSYSCSTCVPPLTIAADGEFHPVADRPYFDSMSVEEVDDRTVKFVRRMGDRQVGDTTVTVSEDGNRATFAWTDSTTPNAPITRGEGTDIRVSPAPEGAHAMSGSWQTEKVDSISDEALTVTFQLDGDTLNMSSPSGQSYSANLDGTAVPVQGDTAGTTVSVERLAPNSFRETYTRDGEVVNVSTLTVTDGTLNVVSENKRTDSTLTYSAQRQ